MSSGLPYELFGAGPVSSGLPYELFGAGPVSSGLLMFFLVGRGEVGVSTLCSDTGGATMGTLGAGVDVRTGNGGAGSGRAVARFRI